MPLQELLPLGWEEVSELEKLKKYYKVHPKSPCLRCRWFVNGWCALGILDRWLAPLVGGEYCPSFEPKGEVSV